MTFIELPKWLYSKLPKCVRNRLKDSHNILEIISSNRKPNDFPSNSRVFQTIFSEKTLLGLMDEGRASTMKWLVLKPDSI